MGAMPLPGTVGRIAFGALIVTAASALAQGENYTSDSLEQVKAGMATGKAVLVDVRERREWDQGHVRGAVLLPLSQLMVWERDGLSAADKTALATLLPKGSVVYCHCAAGHRSLPGGEALRKLGYDGRSLKPGYQELIEAGFPREAGK
jgi:rhodanese-related sulfurtransferase